MFIHILIDVENFDSKHFGHIWYLSVIEGMDDGIVVEVGLLLSL
jgi:hypothetical protein